MKTYFLTKELRPELKKIWGVPIFGPEKEVAKQFKKICQKKKFKKIITVGDYCSLTLLSDVKIFDGRINRNKPVSLQRCSFSCWNPPASINKEVWPILKKAIAENKNVFVQGEEDLLVIPSVILSKEGAAIVYGLTGQGVCLIEVSSEIKASFRKMLEKFKEGRFEKVVLGGTFNGLHPGHRYFLSMAGYYAKEVIVGLCSDEMVKARKKHFKKVRTFEERRKNLKNYLRKIGLKSEIAKIDDIYGLATKDKGLEAILLTEETYPNGRKINLIRKKNNLKELHYVILPYLLDPSLARVGKKISSKNK